MMSSEKFNEPNDAPDIEMSGLRIWIRGRQYPDRHDFCDGNWLAATVHCQGKGALIWTDGELRNTEIAEWRDSLEKLNEMLAGEIILPTLDRFLRITLTIISFQRFTMKIKITPDRGLQRHYLEFCFPQSSLGDLITGCQNILTKFPIKGKPPQSVF